MSPKHGRWLATAILILIVVASSATRPVSGQDDTVPPSGTYGSDRIEISCDASACTANLSPELGGTITMTAVGPGHYQVSKHDDSERGLTCPVPAGATEDADLAYSGDQINLTLSFSGYTTTCGSNTDTVHPSVIPFVFKVGAGATTSTTSVVTSTSTTVATPAIQPPRASPFERRVARMSARQRASLAAATAHRRPATTAALVTPGDAFEPSQLVANTVLAGLLVLLLVFPSELFNSTFDKHHERIERRIRRYPIARRLLGRRPIEERPRTSRTSVFAATLVAGAVIAGFLDPSFGLSTASITFVLGVVVAALVGLSVDGLTERVFRRSRRVSAAAMLEGVPSGLLIAAIGVFVSRLVHFQPGYLYGLVGGLVFAVELERRHQGPAKFVKVLVTLGVALAAWFAFVPVSDAANRTGASPFIHVLDAVLAAAFVGGVEKALFGMVPLEVLPGHAVSRWSWLAWCAGAFGAAFLFVTVLLRPETGYLGHSSTASAVTVYALFVAFGLASVLFWLWFRIHPDDTPAAITQPVSAEDA